MGTNQSIRYVQSVCSQNLIQRVAFMHKRDNGELMRCFFLLIREEILKDAWN